MIVQEFLTKVRLYFDFADKNILKLLWSICYTKGFTNVLPDRVFLELNYRMKTGKKLDLRTPVSFNEKLQWLKLYDRNPRYSQLVDKYEAKRIVGDLIGEQYIIPTIGIYNKISEIDFDALPNSFVIKCTHDSGGLEIVKDKNSIDINAVKEKIGKCLKHNYYLAGREWAYKNVKPRIIIEKYMEDKSGDNGDDGLFDYKIFCFGGTPRLIQVDINRFTNHKRNIYNVDWRYINATIEYPTDPNYLIKRPEVLDEMLILASKLSKGIPFVRVDFYCIQNKIYFGELTLYHGSGTEKFYPESFGEELGQYINLPSKH